MYISTIHLTITYRFDMYIASYFHSIRTYPTAFTTRERQVFRTSVPWSTKPDNTDSLVDAEIKRSMRLLGTNCRSLGREISWGFSRMELRWKWNMLHPFAKDMQDVTVTWILTTWRNTLQDFWLFGIISMCHKLLQTQSSFLHLGHAMIK